MNQFKQEDRAEPLTGDCILRPKLSRDCVKQDVANTGPSQKHNMASIPTR